MPFYCALCSRQRSSKGRVRCISNCGAVKTLLNACVGHRAPVPHRFVPGRCCERCYRAVIVAVKNSEPIVLPSTIREAGLGLFAQRDYKAGERITEYGGKIFDKKEVPLLPTAAFARQLNGTQVIDGSCAFRTNGDCTGLGRYANTSIDPDIPLNARYINRWLEKQGRNRCYLEALVDIPMGVEIFASYGSQYPLGSHPTHPRPTQFTEIYKKSKRARLK